MQRKIRPGRYMPLFLVLFLVYACSLERVLNPDARVYPKHKECITCHRSPAPPASETMQPFAEGVDPSSFCLDCHHYENDHHPVNIVPGKEYSKSTMQSFPFFDGQIRCITCHQAHHTGSGEDCLSEPQKLLRGGPYSDLRDLCFKCHYQETYAKINPHIMLTQDNAIREIDGKPVCLVCHAEKPDVTGDPAKVRFRADVAFLCWRCHPSMTGTFMGQHFHVTPKRYTRAMLKKTQDERSTLLPLARDGMMTCSTCHNPHQQGVIHRAAATTGADAPRRLRMPKEAICSACHRM